MAEYLATKIKYGTDKYILRDHIINGNGKNNNVIFRGKNLGMITAENIGTFVTAHQIAEGNFKDLYLGDYITIQDGTYNKEWMIAAFDWDYKTGSVTSNDEDLRITDHSVTLVPRSSGVVEGRFSSTAYAPSGEYGSEIWTTLHETILPKLQAVIGDYMNNQFIVTKYTSNGKSKILIDPICLMKRQHVMGGAVNTYTDTRGILPVFMFVSPYEYDTYDHTFWLADVAEYSGDYYATYSSYGGGAASMENDATTSKWIRPMIAIKGTQSRSRGAVNDIGVEVVIFDGLIVEAANREER